MYHAHYVKWKKTNNRRNTSAESRKNQKTRRKGKYQVLGDIGSGHHKTSEDERKNNERLSQMNEESSCNRTQKQKSYQVD